MAEPLGLAELFTPSIRDTLPGLPLGGGYRFPTKDELLDYLERYVATFELPVRLGVQGRRAVP